jgi:hypothetical protein
MYAYTCRNCGNWVITISSKICKLPVNNVYVVIVPFTYAIRNHT